MGALDSTRENKELVKRPRVGHEFHVLARKFECYCVETLKEGCSNSIAKEIDKSPENAVMRDVRDATKDFQRTLLYF
jgi:hypothetical protein